VDALCTLAGRSQEVREETRLASRRFAEKTYSPEAIAARLDSYLWAQVQIP
jgi:hypothetical protein